MSAVGNPPPPRAGVPPNGTNVLTAQENNLPPPPGDSNGLPEWMAPPSWQTLIEIPWWVSISRKESPEVEFPVKTCCRHSLPLVGVPELNLSEHAPRQMTEWAAQEVVTRMMGTQATPAPRANGQEEESLSSTPMPLRTSRHSFPATRVEDRLGRRENRRVPPRRDNHQ